MKSLLILLSIFTFSSCSASKGETSNAKLASSNYTILELSGNDVSEKNATISFNLDENKVYGFSGCNNFSGTFTLDKNTITFGPIVATKKMCVDMTTENRLFKLLEGTKNYSILDDKLTLSSDNGTSLLQGKLTTTKQTDVQSKITTFEYKAVTRGYFLLISISNDGEYLTVATEPNMKPARLSYTKAEWQSLMQALDKINLEELPKLEPPSKKFQYDGAQITTLTITEDGKRFQTQAFDNDNPPVEIQEIVKILLSFSEKE